jgi:hypothetical protein
MGEGKDKARKIIGYSLLGLGGASLFVGFSPLFPIYFEAFFLGGIFMVSGTAVLAGKEIAALAKRAYLAFRRTPRIDIDPLLPVRVLGLAKASSGRLTIAEVAIALKIPIEKAEAALDSCVRSGAALQDYDVSDGFVRYSFPEFLPPEERRELLE